MMPSSQATPARARPLAPLATLFVVATIVHALLAGCGGGGQESTTTTGSTETPSTPPPAASSGQDTAAATAAAATGDPVAQGKAIYLARCALCHGPEGKGDGPAAAGLNPKPRNHTDASYMKTRTDAQLLDVIHNGKGAMPAWGKILNEAEMQAVLKYVRTLAK
jgi:mono/diheme cytochrome c family protein